MTVNDVRQKFLEFFKARGHTIVPSASLVPQNDPSVLFTTAGMQQFKPYYTGEKDALKDFGSKNVVSTQKCIRTSDIDKVGDATHLTFFEMLGNFSFGGYGRKEAISYAYDFITKELGLPISYVTVYKGSENVPQDKESQAIWKALGVADIREEGAEVFWGPTGTSGPCGPTTEIYCKHASAKKKERLRNRCIFIGN
ncbi:MAG: alanyl-tRNA synthetase [Parcubacteria group bacterium Gr01-1014_17]|nr:MAG: alanyl-tRNA synthetase [Parcubacteria group bacterium Gr01-1014_17]